MPDHACEQDWTCACGTLMCEECAVMPEGSHLLGETIPECQGCAGLAEDRHLAAGERIALEQERREHRNALARERYRKGPGALVALRRQVRIWHEDGALLRFGILEGALLVQALKGCRTIEEGDALVKDAFAVGRKRLLAMQERDCA